MFERTESFKEYFKLYPVASILIIINIMMYLIGLTVKFIYGTDIFYFRGSLIQTHEDPYNENELWRYITNLFLHHGAIHLLSNCGALYIFAPAVEKLFGRMLFFSFYLLCGVGGNLCIVFGYLLFDNASIQLAAGASGAIYGLLGGMVYLSVRFKRSILKQSKMIIYATICIGFLLPLINPNISSVGHIGGMITGFIMMSLITIGRSSVSIDRDDEIEEEFNAQ